MSFPSAGMRALAPLVVLSIALSMVVTEAILVGHNSLLAHPDWVLTKHLLSSYSPGASEATLTRNLLHRNRLNLGVEVWHGSQEVLLNRIIHLEELKARVSVGEDADVTVVFNKDAAGFAGARLSRRAGAPSMLFRADASGRFVERWPFARADVGAGTHAVALRFQQDGLEAHVDGTPWGRAPLSSHVRQVIGFRAGKGASWVDDVEIRGTDVAIRESFRNTRGAGWLFARALVTTTSSLLVLLAVFRRLRGGRRAMFSVLTLGGTCLAVLTAWLAFDHFWWSGTYYDRLALKVRGNPSAVGIAVEKARERVLGLEPLIEIELHPWSRDFRRGVQPLLAFLGAASDFEPDRDDAIEVVRERDGRVEVDSVDANPAPIEEYLSKKPVARALRIMLLGGSQMWGEGANLRRERIDAAVLTRVTKDVAPTPVVVINGSRRGGVAPFLADRLEEGGLHLFEPAVVVVNLSNNDSANLEGSPRG
jgi:hypothetical protein